MGFRPVVAIYSTFLQRAYDCIHHDVCLQDLPVIFCLDRAGLSANDGPTHHGLYDIAYLRCLPNVIGMAPTDEDELVDMMFTATQQQHPTFIRYPRGAGEGVPIKDQPRLLDIGKAEVLRNFTENGGRKIALFALGNMGRVALQAVELLSADGCNTALINPRFTKPLDEATHTLFGQASDVVVTLEDHTLMGGYGSSVLELFSDRGIATPVVRIGWPDVFVEHASSVDHLRRKHGLTAERLVEQVRLALAEPKEVAGPRARVAIA
jgi:1-deoxy-D-xylulose-5-phosphate synthase